MPQPRSILANRTILLVDALPNSRQMITQILRDYGCRGLYHARHARETLDLLDVTAGRLDLMLCAVELPRVGGLEVVKALRQGRTRGWPTTPVVLFHPRPDHRLTNQAEALDVGYVFGLPIAAAALCEKLAEVMAASPLPKRPAEAYDDAATDWEAAGIADTVERRGLSARQAASRDERRLSDELRAPPPVSSADTHVCGTP